MTIILLRNLVGISTYDEIEIEADDGFELSSDNRLYLRRKDVTTRVHIRGFLVVRPKSANRGPSP